MIADWKPEKEPNMDEEIELIKKWVQEREDFINEQDKTKADSHKSVRGKIDRRKMVCYIFSEKGKKNSLII